jgi:U3 small nucleolar RNA-associated protein 15
MSEFKSSAQLQTKVPSVTSVTLGLTGTSDPGEARFWTQKFGLGSAFHSQKGKYSHPHTLQFKANSNSIVNAVVFGPPAFGSTAPLAVVSGPRVSLYGGTSVSPFSRALLANNRASTQNKDELAADRQVVTGGHPALCATYRADGRLIAVGTDAGEVRVCDVTSRATLCTFKAGAQHAVRTVSWMRSGKQVVSGGDDGVLRLWNLSQVTTSDSKAELALRGHGDAIRCAVVWQPPRSSTSAWKELAMTGSYDHTIRVWNLENPSEGNQNNDRCLAVLSHGAPVEALLLMQNEENVDAPWLLSAGGTQIKVWNPISGTCVCTINTLHSKTITSLVAMTRKEGENQTASWRILTTGLDGLIRIHTWSSVKGELRHIHGVKLSHPVTSLAFNEISSRLAIGTTDGLVLVRQLASSHIQQKRKRDPPAGTFAYFTRGMNTEPGKDDHVVNEGRKRKLKSFDMALRQFRYGDALDDALETRQPQAVSSCSNFTLK